MPTYDYGCPNQHYFEHFCSISARPASIPCKVEGCGLDATQKICAAPVIWPNNFILDYPGSKKLMAGHVHTHADFAGTRVSSGYGGTINPSTAPEHPLAKIVQPDPVKKFPAGE